MAVCGGRNGEARIIQSGARSAFAVGGSLVFVTTRIRPVSHRNRIAWKPQNYEARVASVRIRCLNPLRILRASGMSIELYRERHKSTYHTIIFSKAYNASDVELAHYLKAQGVRIIFDLCDNHFLHSEERVVRLREMLSLADHRVVSSHALAETVRREMDDGKPLEVIEDAVEDQLSGNLLDVAGWVRARLQLRLLDRFLARFSEGKHLVWFGNHKASYRDSGLSHMTKLRPLLETLHASHPLSLTVISNSREAFDAVFSGWKLPVFYMDWSVHTFFSAMRRHDIALIPIEVNEFTAVKTNNRIALSLGLGLGVVADSIDSYRIFSDCAFLDRWEEGLSAYLKNPELSATHARCGQQIIARNFTVEAIAENWRQLLVP